MLGLNPIHLHLPLDQGHRRGQLLFFLLGFIRPYFFNHGAGQIRYGAHSG